MPYVIYTNKREAFKATREDNGYDPSKFDTIALAESALFKNLSKANAEDFPLSIHTLGVGLDNPHETYHKNAQRKVLTGKAPRRIKR